MATLTQMTSREPHPRPHMTNRDHAKAKAHSLLQAELRDIRRSLARLERELEDNVVEIRSRGRDHTKAA